MAKKENESQVKKPLYKKWWLWVIVVVVIGAIGGGMSGDGDNSGSPTTSQQEPQDPPSVPETSQTPDVSSAGTAPGTEYPSVETEPELDARESLDNVLGSTTFYENVRNDVTGRWRLLVFYSSENIVDHALEYYNAYFSSDDEVHSAVNLGLKTTSSITVGNGFMHISVHEYIDGEEHDAKVLGGGELLESYMVNLETGETEKLSVGE